LGDVKNAIMDYSKAIVLYKNEHQSLSSLLLDRGRAYFRIADYKSAIGDFSKVIELNIDLSQAYTYRGLSHKSLKEYQLAINDFTSSLFYNQKNDQLASLYVHRGETKVDLNKYKDAINDFNLALSLNPDLKGVYLSRGYALYANGDYELSSNDYAKAIQLYQDNKKMLVLLYDFRASNERNLQHFDKALENLAQGLMLDPENGLLLWNRATIYSQQGECKLAIDEYNKAMIFYKDNNKYLASMHSSIASELYVLKENKRVIDECTISINLNPNESSPYFTRAKVYLKRLVNKEQAAKDFNKAIELDTSKSTTSYIFSQFYIGNRDLAMQLLQKEILKTPSPHDVLSHYYNIACMFSIMNEPEKANIYLKKAIESGYPKKYAAQDEDFDNIRNTAEYIATMGATK
jgi:tetratricopeptide (TPR) repeat protein